MDRSGIALEGGRSTDGVVRVGDRVHRPLGPHSPFVHELLRHLEAVGFTAAPRLLDVDAQRREVLSYIEGSVPSELGHHSLPQLRAAARLVAAFHAATAGSPLAAGHEVVCHGDLSPCNFVFRDSEPVALIDFDAAHPGPRRLDLGYAAWMWLEIGNPRQDAAELGRRLGAFVEAYGVPRVGDAVAGVLDAQTWLEQRLATSPRQGEGTRRVRSWAARCQAWTRAHRPGLEAGLRNP